MRNLPPSQYLFLMVFYAVNGSGKSLIFGSAEVLMMQLNCGQIQTEDTEFTERDSYSFSVSSVNSVVKN
jgi:hypothetical protein